MNTVISETNGIYKVSGSSFISVITPVLTKEEIDSKRNKFKSLHPSATHICYAYRLASPETVFSTDAGEPKGTAGKPLLNMLLKHQLTNTALLVARYYGGKKLGVSGLIDAYTAAGENALNNAVLRKYIPLKELELEVPYNRINEVYVLAKKHNARVDIIQNGDPVRFCLTLEVDLFESFKNELSRDLFLHSY